MIQSRVAACLKNVRYRAFHILPVETRRFTFGDVAVERFGSFAERSLKALCVLSDLIKGDVSRARIKEKPPLAVASGHP
ncbi:hypothetical protein [uncultured Tateyamaria sp.]|uniref:hypothetical protein n=1 Tax=uncultured Tateyamaria sp. TaxID=455651 RepID=UPI00263828E4|nr:hypothetical protein [uncultured Tateyamaria sp.]